MSQKKWQCQHCNRIDTDYMEALKHWIEAHPGSSKWPKGVK